MAIASQARSRGFCPPGIHQQSPLPAVRCQRRGTREVVLHNALRRDTLAAGLGVLLLQGAAASRSEEGVVVVSNSEGSGQHPAQLNDLVLVHYVGTLEDTGAVFDSTRGGLTYRDGGPGVERPAIIRLGGYPVPGICQGLQQALLGMRVGGTRVVDVPPELGFGASSVLAPYAVVPGNSRLRYEVQLLRLSTKGPDELTRGIVRCGTGGGSESAEGCGQISLLEVL